MTDPLSCSISLYGDTAVVSAAGALDLHSAPLLRAALRKADAEQPKAIVIDLRHLAAANSLSLLVLLAPVEPVHLWYAPRLLCAPSEQLRTALRGTPQTRRLPVYDTREAALAAAREVLADRVVRELPGTPAAPGLARRFLAETCAGWHLDELVPAGQLIISELCANVVMHVGSPMTVVLLRTPGHLHIVVRDRDATPPVPGPPMAGSIAPSGRGIRLVEQLATGWGFVPTPTGKAVWALLRRPTTPA